VKPPSSAIQRMGRSGIREIFDLANTIPDAIHLEMGEPDFPTPANVVEAAHRAGLAGITSTPPTPVYESCGRLWPTRSPHATESTPPPIG